MRSVHLEQCAVFLVKTIQLFLNWRDWRLCV